MEVNILQASLKPRVIKKSLTRASPRTDLVTEFSLLWCSSQTSMLSCSDFDRDENGPGKHKLSFPE